MQIFGKSISLAELKQLAREKAGIFLHFAFNRDTGEFFGKTCKSWGLTFGYLFLLYSVLGAIFAVHLAIFFAVTPQPGQDVSPVNFGRYAYPNYPNSRIGLIAVPESLSYNGNQASLSSSQQSDIDYLISSASSSDVPDPCLDEGTKFGYDSGTPCIFFRVQKVMEWTPEEIDESLSSSPTLPLTCTIETITGLDVEVTQRPDGLPLNLPNHISPSRNRSYPFRGRDSSYITPVMGVMVNLTAIDPGSISDRRFSIKITCGVNLTAVGLVNPPPNLSRIYELPKSASTTISVSL